MSTTTKIDTREAIMTAARLTVQNDGYNALSFRDLATAVGVKSSSIHYYFPTKGDLADALLCRFSQDFSARMEPLLDKTFEAAIEGYIAMFRGAFEDANRMCLGGMMSAEVSALPESARKGIGQFAEAQKDFLKAVLVKKHPRLAGDKLDARATAIFAAMEGAQLIAHGLGGDLATFDLIVASYKTSGLFD